MHDQNAGSKQDFCALPAFHYKEVTNREARDRPFMPLFCVQAFLKLIRKIPHLAGLILLAHLGSTQVQAQNKQIPVVQMPGMQEWLARYKAQGWAKCRMSAIDTFSLTQGKASTEIFVAIRHINDKMDELEDYLEKSGLTPRKLAEMRAEEARLLSYMTLEQKSLLFKECALSIWE